jgi:glyoxylase-like metal-dependent hydrolase (beta-lactamase superfamily II)
VGVVVDELSDLGITRVSRWCFNCYVITGDNASLVVVDPGMPAIVGDLVEVLAHRPGKVRLIAATHGHCDHVGGAALAAQRHGATIYLPATTMSYLDGAKPRTPSAAKLAGPAWKVMRGQPFDVTALAGFVRGALTMGFGTSRGMLWRGPRPTGALEEGMPLPGAPKWTVLTTPGHTDDSIALWNEDSRTLLAGDALFTTKGKPRFASDTVDDAAAARTETKLKALPVEHLLPGHGLPVHTATMWR